MTADLSPGMSLNISTFHRVEPCIFYEKVMQSTSFAVMAEECQLFMLGVLATE